VTAFIRAFALLVLLAVAQAVQAEVTVAVASNFARPAKALAAAFERETGERAVIVTGSTGKLYAQIVNGAPFDVFLAADAERPRRLESDGVAIRGSRFTYARGALSLWSPDPGLVDRQGTVLSGGEFRRLAIANPRLAPYGAAAREVMERLGVWDSLQGRIVFGENIMQAYQFVVTGNTELAFLARSQVPDGEGSRWDVPLSMHSPIEQQAVTLRDSAGARSFAEFLKTSGSAALIERHGYAGAQ
jgi:molybdate transport system substrate-binding protein